MSAEAARVRWRCRRGLKELDLLLEGFMDRGYAALNPAQHSAFLTLLQYPDALLLDYLLERAIPHDKELVDVIQRIRRAVTP